MAIRQFVFCDICNPDGIRNIEQRRGLTRNKREGRRIYDGRAWFEGELSEAVEKHDWSIASDGRHICQNCRANMNT